MKTSVTLSCIGHSGPKQKAIAEHACELLQSAVNHPEFRARIEGMYYEENTI